ncbi:MAG: hypothetical protein P4L31_08380 [Candidatus Babeliales bacterium]|nr:hypothetical protein [Candidatus Babeliales bacterium]
MKEKIIIQSSILAALLAIIPIKLHAQSHVYNTHAINATIEMLEDQSKEHNNYQELEQLCGSLKQQNQRQTMQLDDTRTELALMQARLEKQTEKNSKQASSQDSSNKELIEQLSALKKEKNNATKHLAQVVRSSNKQKEELANLQNALASLHDEKETLHMAQANLNQELLCAHQEIEKYTAIAQEYSQLKQQMAQAQSDLQSPHAKRVQTMKQAHTPVPNLLASNKSSYAPQKMI